MDYKLLADEILLKLLKADDEFAFKEIYRRYWQRLYYAALNKINSREVAEDILQTVFTDLWDKRTQHTIQNIGGYLDAAVKYQVINYIKAAISITVHLSNYSERKRMEESDADLLILVQELNNAIDRAIAQLPKKTQTIFRLSRFEKQSNKDISRIMDLSEKAVEYHITQSLKILRLHLKDFMLLAALIYLL
jgi:RNA polymerase sigma-70 factor (ECF subfamily)